MNATHHVALRRRVVARYFVSLRWLEAILDRRVEQALRAAGVDLDDLVTTRHADADLVERSRVEGGIATVDSAPR